MTRRPSPAAGALELFLQPGEFYFADAPATRIRTVLGSCVAITLWHPGRSIGGMCHFMLPGRIREDGPPALDGRYADEALQLFLRELRRTGSRPGEYRAKLFGGGEMFPESARPAGAVATRNIEVARSLVAAHGFAVQAHDLGGRGHRNVVFDVWSGDVWLRRVPLNFAPEVAR